MGKQKQKYHLPDGTETTKVSQYIRAWRLLGSTVARLLGSGWHCYAFDPDLALGHSKHAALDVDGRLALAIFQRHYRASRTKQEIARLLQGLDKA